MVQYLHYACEVPKPTTSDNIAFDAHIVVAQHYRAIATLYPFLS